MFKALRFYVIDEITDVNKYCKHKGFKPYNSVMKTLDGKPFEVVTQYTKSGYIYDVLNWDECYSGYMVTLAQRPQLSFKELVGIALTSKNAGERAGAIGILLKNHVDEFEKYLSDANENDCKDKTAQKEITRMATFIYDFVWPSTSYVEDLERIMLLCEKLKSRHSSSKRVKVIR